MSGSRPRARVRPRAGPPGPPSPVACPPTGSERPRAPAGRERRRAAAAAWPERSAWRVPEPRAPVRRRAQPGARRAERLQRLQLPRGARTAERARAPGRCTAALPAAREPARAVPAAARGQGPVGPERQRQLRRQPRGGARRCLWRRRVLLGWRAYCGAAAGGAAYCWGGAAAGGGAAYCCGGAACGAGAYWGRRREAVPRTAAAERPGAQGQPAAGPEPGRYCAGAACCGGAACGPEGRTAAQGQARTARVPPEVARARARTAEEARPEAAGSTVAEPAAGPARVRKPEDPRHNRADPASSPPRERRSPRAAREPPGSRMIL